VKDITYRTVPLVRRELDKQLTAMVLVQDVFTFFILLPIMTLGFISLNPNNTQDPLANAEFQLANVIAVMFYYLYFSVSIKSFCILLYTCLLIVLGSILYLCMCFWTIPSSIEICFLRYSSKSMATTKDKCYSSNNTYMRIWP
jgi:hypothetical protein